MATIKIFEYEDDHRRCSFCGEGKRDGLMGLIQSRNSDAAICVNCSGKIHTLLTRTEFHMKAIAAEWGDKEPEATGDEDCPCPNCELNRRMTLEVEKLSEEDTTGMTPQ